MNEGRKEGRNERTNERALLSTLSFLTHLTTCNVWAWCHPRLQLPIDEFRDRQDSAHKDRTHSKLREDSESHSGKPGTSLRPSHSPPPSLVWFSSTRDLTAHYMQSTWFCYLVCAICLLHQSLYVRVASCCCFGRPNRSLPICVHA